MSNCTITQGFTKDKLLHVVLNLYILPKLDSAYLGGLDRGTCTMYFVSSFKIVEKTYEQFTKPL